MRLFSSFNGRESRCSIFKRLFFNVISAHTHASLKIKFSNLRRKLFFFFAHYSSRPLMRGASITKKTFICTTIRRRTTEEGWRLICQSCFFCTRTKETSSCVPTGFFPWTCRWFAQPPTGGLPAYSRRPKFGLLDIILLTQSCNPFLFFSSCFFNLLATRVQRGGKHRGSC